MKMRSYNFCHTNTKNPGNNLGIFCLITGRPKLNGYVFIRSANHTVVTVCSMRRTCYPSIAVFPRRKVIKIQRNRIMLTNLTVTITVRLVEPRINGGMLLPVGTDFCSCLDLDIHRCKVRQNPNIMQPPVYHTFWGLRTA